MGIDPKYEMDWKGYSLAFGVFGVVNIILLYFALCWQAFLPWFFPKVVTTPMTPDLAANTAVRFATATTWQAYAGETTMSYLSELLLAGQISGRCSRSRGRRGFHSRLRARKNHATW